MLIVFLKFAEVGTRAVFVVLTAYLLPLEQAGQFGILVTMQGVASFGYGYERHTDIQRRMAGVAPGLFDQSVGQALWLYGVNYLWITPIYVAILISVADLPPLLIVPAVAVAVAEQLMNQAYLMSMVNRRYLSLLFVAVLKNALIVLGFFILAYRGELGLDAVLTLWACVSVFAVVVTAILWLRLRHPADSPPPALLTSLRDQIRASWYHFLLGLTAIFTLQLDRLLIGGILPLADVGVYFRHVLLVSMIYQVFNIAFHNRALPMVFALARTAPLAQLQGIIRREYVRVIVFILTIVMGGLVVLWMLPAATIEKYALVPLYFASFLLVATIRMRADLNGLVFNSLHREKTIFHIQLASFAFTAPILVLLTWLLGVPGTILATGFGALAYLILSTLSLKKLPQNAFNG